MSCCNKGVRSAKSIRSQALVVERPRTVIAQKIKSVPKKHSAKTTTLRQYIIPRDRCPDCGYPMMFVNIGSRERSQCSNSNCRKIIK